MSKNQLHIRDEGRGRPLVLVHGWSCPGQFFCHQVEQLKAHARCITPDLPGHGKTCDLVPLSIEASADALYGYLRDQDLSDIVVCGWSMGALVVYSMLERYGGDRFSAVVAIDMSPKVLNTLDWSNGTLSGLTPELNTHFLEAIVADWPKLPSRIARRLFAENERTNPGTLDFARNEIAKADPQLLQPMWKSLTAQDFRQTLKTLKLPFHLAAGLQSFLYGQGVHRWHEENVADFHLHGFERSGHAPHLEEPEKFNELLLTLIRQ
ncbi:MAG: alpha/beta hydrolase [Roseibium sp.]|uniref:alpha/beta fold hydrolase n=1 Tax=Roseibium sp. TaxID=1936156 RepID=UPI00261F9EAE|nr:alpha/beta hydrolase [Roseibium sp.]MCV0425793.1 alpha/beta hydrolase [Roseibium sp.]